MHCNLRRRSLLLFFSLFTLSSSFVNHVLYWKCMATFHVVNLKLFGASLSLSLCLYVRLLVFFTCVHFIVKIFIFSTYYYGFLILCVVRAYNSCASTSHALILIKRTFTLFTQNIDAILLVGSIGRKTHNIQSKGARHSSLLKRARASGSLRWFFIISFYYLPFVRLASI